MADFGVRALLTTFVKIWKIWTKKRRKMPSYKIFEFGTEVCVAWIGAGGQTVSTSTLFAEATEG